MPPDDAAAAELYYASFNALVTIKNYATVCSCIPSRLQTLIHHHRIECSTHCVVTLAYALTKHMRKCSHGLTHIWTG